MSQAQEIKNLQLMRTTEARQLRDTNARARVNQDYEVKISDLKKNHVVEVQQMTIRHHNDAEQVKKVRQARGGGKK